MNEEKRDCYWIGPDGVELPVADSRTLFAKVLAGEIGEDDLVRMTGGGPWIRVSTLREELLAAGAGEAEPDGAQRPLDPALPEPLEPASEQTVAGDGGWERSDAPWRRLIARLFDFFVAGLIFGMIAWLLFPESVESPGSEFILGILAMVTVFPILDAFSLSRWGSSPGKWLLAVRTVRPSGESLALGEALHRSYNLVIGGLLFGIPIISLIPLAMAHGRTKRGEPQPWEVSSRTHTEVHPLGARVLLIAAGLVLLFLLNLLARAG